MGSLLANPSYITQAQFAAMPLDYDITGYSTSQQQDILNRASGKANSIMRRNLLAREQTIRILGDGTNKLETHRGIPLLYIKRVQIAIPGTTGMYIPLDQILIDYTSGSILEYTPMLWNGLGYFARFPSNIPVDITLGFGYGYNPYVAPTYTTTDANGNLTAGTYNLAVTTQTMNGETTAVVKQVSTTNGAIQIGINETLGAYLYRAYISSAANNTDINSAAGYAAGSSSFVVDAVGTIAPGDILLFDTGASAEYLTVATVNSGTKTITTTTASVYAHADECPVIEQPLLVQVSPFTAYGSTSITMTVSSLTATQGLWQDSLPLSDSSAPVLPEAITEAVRLLAMSIIYEQNNLANRGVYMQRSNRKELSWRSTEGTAGKGVPLFVQEAMSMLQPYALQAIY